MGYCGNSKDIKAINDIEREYTAPHKRKDLHNHMSNLEVSNIAQRVDIRVHYQAPQVFEKVHKQ